MNRSIILAGWEASAMAALEAGSTMLLSRPMNPQPCGRSTIDMRGRDLGSWYPFRDHPKAKHYATISHLEKGIAADFAPWQPGDVLLCRETFSLGTDTTAHGCMIYRCDERTVQILCDMDGQGDAVGTGGLVVSAIQGPWRSASTMPLWAVRLKPTVVSVSAVRIAEEGQDFFRRHRIPEYDAGSHCIDGMCGDAAWYMGQWDRRWGKRYPWGSAWAWTLEVRR